MVDRISWGPQPGPQAALVRCPVEEIFYGGARGGGKTDGMLGKFGLKAARHGKHVRGIFFRREYPQLDAAIDRSREIYNPLGAEWSEMRKLWTFPNGATLRFRSLERDADAEKYQGHSYTDVFFEELGNYPNPIPVMKLKATLRSAEGVPCQFHATGNPGGPGHNWVKMRYVDPAPLGWEIIEEHNMRRIFIPAKVDDNQLLMTADPGYVDRLKQTGSPELVRAWLEGDWDVVEGAFFECWRAENHVIEPFAIPDYWLKFRAFDWGSSAPFSVGWWAVSDGLEVDDRVYPKGALIRYREWYGASAPNVGLKLTNERIAQGIIDREDETITYSVADPSIFAVQGGPSIAEQMAKAGILWRKADNRRVGPRGAMSGWAEMRSRMIGDDNPMIYCFKTCVDSIRTIPSLPHDVRRPEDIDSSSEDHAADEWRYACMSRPWAKKKKPTPADITKKHTFDEMLKYTEQVRGTH
jgi:hypothetical protein